MTTAEHLVISNICKSTLPSRFIFNSKNSSDKNGLLGFFIVWLCFYVILTNKQHYSDVT